MKIVFMGTPEFSLECLQSLIEQKYDIPAVFTQPDKPKGRKYVLTPPPVKELALRNNIKVYQPNTLKNDEVVNILKDINPDVIVVVAYGKILPQKILDIPKYGCINVHASLLPKYRGAAPIQWSIINGEKTTGVTTMLMDKGLDTGDILLKSEVKIDKSDTAGTLHDKLSKVGAELLITTLGRLCDGRLTRITQDDSNSCYSPMIFKKDGIIDWNKTAGELDCFIRGMNPFPSAYTRLDGKLLKIHSAAPLKDKKGTPGEVISLNPLIIGCKDGSALEIIKLQLEGKRAMCANDFLKGHKIEVGAILG